MGSNYIDKLVHHKHLYSLEIHPPEDIIDNNQGDLALVAGNVDGVKGTMGSVSPLGGVVYLDDWDCTAGVVGGLRGRHSSK